MPQPLPERATATFTPSAQSPTARQLEALNVCRVTALSALLGDSAAVDGLTVPLRELGFSEHLLANTPGPIDLVDAIHTFQRDQTQLDRVELWEAVNDPYPEQSIDGATRRAQSTGTLLLAVLGSPLELESTAAAAALWREARRYVKQIGGTGRRWLDLLLLPSDRHTPVADSGDNYPPQDPPDDEELWDEHFPRELLEYGVDGYELITLLELVWARLLMAARSAEQVARDLAAVAFAPGEPSEEVTSSPPPHQRHRMARTPTPSTIVHGTWGWYGSWWRPAEPFHQFITDRLRSAVYSRGAIFSWSGYYRAAHRRRAAEDFVRWAHEIAPDGLDTVFAHSYGAEVVARGILGGVAVDELVLLSAPVTKIVEQAVRCMIDSGRTVIDVRLPTDPVLFLDGTRQRFPSDISGINEVLLRWRLGHGATHEPLVWNVDEGLGNLRERMGRR